MTADALLDRSDPCPGNGALSRRRETADDAPFRLRLFRESHGGIFAGLDPALIDVLIGQQVAAQTMAYAANHRDARFEIIEHEHLPIGRMVVDQTTEAITLVDIAVLEAWRGRGIGGRVLGALLDEAEDACAAVHLNVALDNSARRLYARLGFATVDVNATHAAMRWDPPAQRASHASGPNGRKHLGHPGRSAG